MANIIPLKDSAGAQFYPQTHEKAVIDSNGVTLASKLANISAPSYVVAWDGNSTPVVANIPAGVTFTYGGQTYTGTLAASSSTVNKTYLVYDNNGNFDEYITQVSGSTYSWVHLGNTEINLANYATKAELSQLDQKVSYDALAIATVKANQAIYWSNGAFTSANTCTTYVIPNDGYKKVVGLLGGGSTSFVSVGFYSGEGVSADTFMQSSSLKMVSSNQIEVSVDVPQGCKTIAIVNRNSGYATPSAFLEIDNAMTRVSLVDQKVAARIAAFFSRGYLNADNTNRRFVATGNIFYQEGGVQYVVNANTQIAYPASFGGALQAIVLDKANSTFIIKAISALSPTDIIVAGFYPTGSNTVDFFVFSSVRVTVDGVDTEKKVSLLENNRLCPVFTRGFINCDNTSRKFIVTTNITLRLNGASFIIPANTEVAYDWNLDVSLYKVVFDYDNLTLSVVKWNVDSIYPVLFQFYTTGTPPVITSISNAVVPIKFNGVSLEEQIALVSDAAGEGRNYDYFGERVVINLNRFGRRVVNVASSTGQSFASYGDFIVACSYDDSASPSVITAKLMSISQTAILATLSLPYGDVHRPHCNTCCFGNEFGSADSIVPLLYVSQWDYGYERGVLVYDIKLINGEYSVELVQTIIPDNIGVEYLGNGDVDWVVDTDNSMLYALAYYLSGSSAIVEGNKEMICKFALPRLSDGATVRLLEGDIVDNWEMDTFNHSQDKCYNSGKLYILSGDASNYPQWTKIRVLDLSQKEIISEIPLAQFGGEPEGIDVVQGFLAYSYGGSSIYRLIF